MGFKRTLAKIVFPLIFSAGVVGIVRGAYIGNYNSGLDEEINNFKGIQSEYGLKAVSRNKEIANGIHNDFYSWNDSYIKGLINEAKEFQKKADSCQPKIDSLENKKISFWDF